MRRNPIEGHRLYIIGVTAAALFGAAVFGPCLTRQEQPQLPEPTPIAGPAIPGAQAEEEKQAIPSDLQLFMRNPSFMEWRKSLNPQVKVSITDYGSTRRTGRIISEVGLLWRTLPDTQQGGSLKGMPGLEWGATPDWRFQITVQIGDDLYEFVMRHERIKIPWERVLKDPSRPEPFTLDNSVVIDFPEQRYFEGSFATLKTPKDGVLIEARPEPENTTVVNWPRPQ